MKRIVNGVTYNMATSTMLASSSWTENNGTQDFHVLYQTRGGAFFVVEKTTRRIWNEEERRHDEMSEDRFVPKSPDEAHKWIMSGDIEVYNNPFDDPPEAAAEAEPGATIYIRVPAALKRKVDAAAGSTQVSTNVWAMRCVESCLDPAKSTDPRIELANVILENEGFFSVARDLMRGAIYQKTLAKIQWHIERARQVS